jgi:hypothetical protein
VIDAPDPVTMPHVADQVTLGSAAPVTVAVKSRVSLAFSCVSPGAMETMISRTCTVAVALRAASAALVALTS